ncbi:MAG TPA: hypothetical protein VKE70_33535 [Candidatus Solibacter sp.]|nr:hypothetical protein [Candidatus Solibacter sp.]
MLPDEHLEAWRVTKVKGSEADTHSNISDEKRRIVTGEQRLEPFTMQTIEFFEQRLQLRMVHNSGASIGVVMSMAFGLLSNPRAH